jgi:hypothetical protein
MALAAQPIATAPTFTDVALAEGGTLRGVVINAEGEALPQAKVSVLHDGKQIATTTTNEQGQFRVAQLRGGIHQVVAGEGTSVYRLWAPETAPPSATQQAMVVADGGVQRGQNPGPIKRIVTNPWVVAGVVAAAIAVPIALNNNNNKKSGS